MSRTKTVSLAGWRDVDLDSVTIRTTTSRDTLDAAARCAVGDDGVDPALFGLMLRLEMVNNSIVDYVLRTDPVRRAAVGGCVEAKGWSSRTREFLGELYDHLNGMAREEREDFRKSLASGDESEIQSRA